MEITPLPRKFRFKNFDHPDPDPTMTTEQVLNFYSAKYPDLTSSTISGPIIHNDMRIYEFKSVLGTKG